MRRIFLPSRGNIYHQRPAEYSALCEGELFKYRQFTRAEYSAVWKYSQLKLVKGTFPQTHLEVSVIPFTSSVTRQLMINLTPNIFFFRFFFSLLFSTVLLGALDCWHLPSTHSAGITFIFLRVVSLSDTCSEFNLCFLLTTEDIRAGVG